MYKGYLVSMDQNTGFVTVFNGTHVGREVVKVFDSPYRDNLAKAYIWIDGIGGDFPTTDGEA